MEEEQQKSDMIVGECMEDAQGGDNLNEGDAATNGVPDVNSLNREVCKPIEHVNTHKVPPIYREDVVRKNGGMIGVVTEVAGESDSDSDITDEDTDDDEDEDEDEDEEGDEEEYVENDGQNVDEEVGCDENEDIEQNADKNKNDCDCKNSPLAADQVRVLWLNDDESSESLSELTVVDRGFLHGDYVAAASDPTGQVGVVVDVSLSVDLSSPDGSKIEDVSTKELKRVRDLTVGDYVVLGPWLGRIDDVTDNVTVLFDDGSACKVLRADPLRLRPITKSLLDDGHYPYYPGQRVRASSSTIFKNSRWLSGVWKANRMEGTVSKVSVGSVFIYWIASAGYGPNCSTAPAEEQSPKNLKLLSSFAHANWQLGDWCLFPSSGARSFSSLDKGLSKLGIHDSNIHSMAQTGGTDDFEDMLEESQENDESMDVDARPTMNEDKGKNESNSSNGCARVPFVPKEPLHRKKIRKVVVRRDKKPRKKEENFERAFLIANIMTRVDVSWQDGTVQCGVDSTSLIPIESPGDHDFVPEQYVVEKASDDGAETFEVKRVGVVKSINAKERTACVKWLKPVSRAEDPREFQEEEVVSVYELEGHPDYDYCYGDVVVRLTPVSVSADSTSHENENNVTKHKKSLGTEKEDPSCDEADLDSPDLSWVGNITGLRNGDIEVTWADGMVSTVGPQAIYVVGRDDDDDSVDGASAVSDDAASWETVEDDQMGAIDNDEEEKQQNASDRNSESDDGEEISSGRNAALSLPLAAIGYVTRLASGIFSRGRNDVESNCIDSNSENELQSPGGTNTSEDKILNEESGFQESDIVKNCDLQNGKREEVVKAESDLMDKPHASCSTETVTMDARTSMEHYKYSFKRFDIVGDPVDHHFLGTAGQTNGRKWLKKVQQDWSILQSNLPDGIFVRVYEDRMDLLRAVIVGAYGTPYQDGLFFFDFHLPPEYPNVPPSAHYHSGGWRVNPNLYEEGKVCLSLLNTWTGRGNEVWDPLSSSILQVLVSLQGLVLNSRPYFNEAGYDKQVGTAEGEKNSLSYNENTFLLNCKTIMYLIRKPPKDFDELVKEHFKKRGYYILKACDAYMKGYLIGSLAKDASVCNESSANSTSVGFKLMLAKIVPKLYLALNEVGAACHEFKHLQQS